MSFKQLPAIPTPPLRLPSLHIVHTGADGAAVTRPVGVEGLVARLIHALVRVCAKVVALRLNQIRRQPSAANAVEEGQRRGESGHRYAEQRGLRDNHAQRRDASLQLVGEERIEDEVLETRVAVERLLDVAQETRADDAATAPHLTDPTKE